MQRYACHGKLIHNIISNADTHMILPRYQSVLYMAVACPRCEGYAISVMSIGAALAAKVRPNPMRKRAPMNIPTDCDAD